MGNEENINLEYVTNLSSGATVAQSAKLYKNDDIIDYRTSKDLGYTDIVNLSLALNIISEFYDVCATVFVKNNTLTSVALGSTTFDSFQKAVDGNPVDAICGVVALTKTVDLDIIKLLTSQHLVVASDFTDAAFAYMEDYNINYVKLNTPLKDYKKFLTDEYYKTPFGVIVQDKNKQELDKDSFKVVSKTKPTVEQVEDAIFAWKIIKHIKSSAVVVAKDFKTSGIAQGIQTPAFEYALDNACDNSKSAVLASDVPLTVHDLNVAIQDRIALIIQPGVTEEVLKQADKFEITMRTTGISNFSLV